MVEISKIKELKFVLLGILVFVLVIFFTIKTIDNKEKAREIIITSGKYINNQDGTITDKETGLMWQMEEVYDVTLEKSKETASELVLGGYNDWRAPTVIELLSIVDVNLRNPPFETSLGTSESEYFWSSESKFGDQNKFWVLNAGGGIGDKKIEESHAAGGEKIYSLKCVRGSMNIPITRFTDNKDGTITDNFNGLIWQQESAKKMNLVNAKKYSVSLVLGGSEDWRLPSITELAMLCDRNYKDPAIDKNYFLNIASERYWTGTNLAMHDDKQWFVDMEYGMTSYDDPSAELYVICVRNSD